MSQFWNESFFERISLKTLGLKIQLGHPIGSTCPSPTQAFNDDFTIINDNGIHQVSLMYCGCQQAHRHIIQLLRAQLFPSTTINPRTAATFRVLETFQMLGFTAKTTLLDFYKALEARTDNTGTALPPVHSSIFITTPLPNAVISINRIDTTYLYASSVSGGTFAFSKEWDVAILVQVFVGLKKESWLSYVLLALYLE